MGRNQSLRVGILLLSLSLAVLTAVTLFHGTGIPLDMNQRLAPAGQGHPLGTDDLGRDFLACLARGAWLSLAISLAVVTLAALVGTVLGALAGFCGGIVDSLVMRSADVILAFPGFLLALAVVSFAGSGFIPLIGALAFSSWVGFARLIRGEVIRHKQSDFIQAARGFNASTGHILRRHLLPLILPLVVTQATVDLAGVILAESSLNFLGLGLPPDIPTLGQLIDNGRGYLFHHTRLMILPGVVLFLLILSVSLVGDGLRRRFSR